MKDMQTEQLLCWSGMTDAEHSILYLVEFNKGPTPGVGLKLIVRNISINTF